MKQQKASFLHRLPDILLGVSLISWAIAGTVRDFLDWEGFFPVRMSLAILQAFVGILIVFRPPPLENGAPKALLLSFPSFLISGLLFRLAEPLSNWPLISKWIFALSVVWVLFSFWSLRKSFAILPARRAIVKSGPYRLLRHPAYAGELLMAAACTWAAGNLWASLSFAALIPFLMLRIQQEEAILENDAGFLAYKKESRWRLFPWIW